MYLEKLEIQGFKSFAYKNKLIFPGFVSKNKKGLTAIVGPNGSGKSNIADAIRWVLGEQSLKTLRSKKSEDVIFSGSDKKSRLGLAEVSLYLNNEDGVAKNKNINQENESDLDKIINTCTEIVITRRVFRNSESEYLINNTRSRLSDIQMLLAKASFGQKTYSVIGQGMVDNFLNSSVADRKDFFDEATGVKQFQIKRDNALNKLELSYNNLQQVEMLLSEIRPRLKSLTRQMDKLKKRTEIESKLNDSQINYYSYLWQDINQKLNTINKNYLELEKIKRSKEKNLESLNDELNRIRTNNNFQRINELQPLLRDLSDQKNIYQKKLAKLEIELETQLESRGQFDLSWLNSKLSELKSELENINLEIESLQKSYSHQEEETLKIELADIEKELNRSAEIQKKINRLNNDKEENKNKLTRLEAVLEANLTARAGINFKSLKEKRKKLKEEGENLNKEITELTAKYNKKNNNPLLEELHSLQEKIKTLNIELQQINEKIQKAAKSGGKEETINNIIKDFLQKLDQIETITDFKEAKKLLKTAKSKFQEEIKAILTGESDEDTRRIQSLQQAIIELTENRQIINEKINQNNNQKAKIKEEINALLERKTRLEWELVTLEQDLKKEDIEKEETLKNDINSIKQNLHLQTEELNRLIQQNKTDYLLEKKQTILNKLQNCRFKDSTLKEKIKLLNEQKEKIATEIEEIKIKIQKGQTKFDAFQIEKEKTKLLEKITAIEKEETTLNNELSLLNQAKEEEKNQMFICQKKIQILQTELTDYLNELNNLKIDAARQETKLEDLENNIRNNNLNLNEVENHPAPKTPPDLDALQKNINNYKNQLEQIGGIDEETEKEYANTKERYDFLFKQTDDLNKTIKSLEQIIKELDIKIKERFDKEFKIISEKFNEYFQILFSGGNAKISKVMLEDLENQEKDKVREISDYIETGLSKPEAEIKLTSDEKMRKIKFLKKHNAVGLAGIEIQANPPGKKIQSVTMLSGGERALTAIALICAIISANPAPFVVLDEVDAALDESNSERLAKILDDLSDKSQFIVITHNRASMRRANIIYGVTMKNDGVSQIISIKLDEVDINKIAAR
ncbi:MAG: chromosome segregation protein [Patescibacteria group bacterium]|nr:chromosome segregation protein [Patescibacteria group bacterium]